MKVLVIGKGGREHALVHAVSRSGRVKKIYAAPGNPGMAELAECVNIADSDVKGLTAFAKEQEIDLTIVGPEATLSLGIVDAFQAEGLKIFGPTKDAAQVESSKDGCDWLCGASGCAHRDKGRRLEGRKGCYGCL